MVALHCSGSTGRQWSALAERLGADFSVHAPDLIGTASRGHWSGAGPFSLAEEAAPIIELLEWAEAPIHLVGHSYGGGLALHIALTQPPRIASLALYEPSAFHLLSAMGPHGAEALAEIRALAAALDEGVLTGAYQAAAARFIDYWNGEGAWQAMGPRLRTELVRYLPKACLDFRALLDEPGSLASVCRLGCPLLLLRGEHAPRPTRLIADGLAGVVAHATAGIVSTAGHMGPLTHAERVAEHIAEFVRRAEDRAAKAAEAPASAAMAA